VKPKIYPAESHHIRDEHVDAEALFVLSRLQGAGFTAYLVGGGVRDLLMGRPPKDFDISTSAEPEQIKRLFRNCILIGRRFRLAHIRFGRKIIEVSTFRCGDSDEAELIVRDNEWGTPEEDVLRRDFTINGLFYDPSDHKIIDYVGGHDDLKKNLLRTIGDPVVRFVQDPVRMLRCLKFRARFALNIDPPIMKALESCHDELLKSSPARVLEEVLRMLEGGSSEPFIRLLHEHHFLELLFPHIKKCSHEEIEEIFALLCSADQWVNAARDRPPSRAALLACILYPSVIRDLEAFHARLDAPPHLGRVHDRILSFAANALDDAFLHIPRRLRASMVYVLDAQYRFTPLSPKKLRRERMVQQAEFLYALQFLKLRSLVETHLNNCYLSWKQLYRTYRRGKYRRSA